MAIEKPTYRTVDSRNGVELRDYDPYWIAECRVDRASDLNDASNRAFGSLFRYISGDNSAGQKIAMTAPVQQVPSELGWLVSFVVPRAVAEGDIPVPASSAITLRMVPAGKFAALVYSGVWNGEKFAAMSAKLLAAVSAMSLQPDGPVFSAVYNPPFMPPFLRRNEVLVRVARNPEKSH